MGGKGSGRKDTGAFKLLRAHIKDEFKLKRDKLTEEEVDKIKELRAQGLTQTAIARQLGVCQATVSVYLMSPEDRKAYTENRNYARKLWLKNHNYKELYKRVLKRKRHLKSIGGLIEEDDWKTGVNVYEKQS